MLKCYFQNKCFLIYNILPVHKEKWSLETTIKTGRNRKAIRVGLIFYPLINMHMRTMKVLLLGIVLMTGMTACTNIHRAMREPNVRVDLTKSDFTLSDQVTGEATSTRIFMIDFSRLFNKTTGSVESPVAQTLPINLATIPVIGNALFDPTANYALYEMMKQNPGYDVVFYPQYETKVVRPIGIGFIVKTTTVKATARLGKLNK